jgi:hypothetical protein
MRETPGLESRANTNRKSNEYGESRAALARIKYLDAFLTGVKQATDK